jgi:hypothetical protein
MTVSPVARQAAALVVDVVGLLGEELARLEPRPATDEHLALDHCPGPNPPFWAVKRPARPDKGAIQPDSLWKTRRALNRPAGPRQVGEPSTVRPACAAAGPVMISPVSLRRTWQESNNRFLSVRFNRLFDSCQFEPAAPVRLGVTVDSDLLVKILQARRARANPLTCRSSWFGSQTDDCSVPARAIPASRSVTRAQVAFLGPIIGPFIGPINVSWAPATVFGGQNREGGSVRRFVIP